MMFMTAFNAAMLTTWFVGGASFWRRWRGLPPKLPALLHDGATARMRFAHNAGAVAALAGVGASSLIGVFVQSVDATLASMQIAWGAVLAIGAVLGLLLWLARSGGAFDLIIGENAVTLPERLGRWQRVTIERSKITGVIVKPGWRGLFRNQIRLQCGDGQSERIAAWYDEDAANAIAAYLNDTLRRAA